MTEEESQKECEKRQAHSDAYRAAHYGDSVGPRRGYHWESQGGEPVLVED